MSSELRELYQSVILDHNKRPRNCCKPECANRSAEGINPLCGDQLTVYLAVDDDVVTDVGFNGTGCAISTASASLMTQAIKGKKIEEVEQLFDGISRNGDFAPAVDRRNRRARKAFGLLGCSGIPDAGEVRDARVARDE